MSAKLLQSARDVISRFPDIPSKGKEITKIDVFNQRFRFGVSEEMIDYMEKDVYGVPRQSDPLARLYWPFPDLLTGAAPTAYDQQWDNWEMPGDFPIPNNFAWQWKYSDRICHRAFGCEEKCLFCFEVIRVLDKEGHKKSRPEDWPEGIAFIRAHPEITEVIFTGGEPLVAPDSLLAKHFAEVRSIPHIERIRIHTAKGVHDTSRLSEDFAQLCARFRVTEIAFQILHPRQVTARFEAAMERLARGCGSVIRLAHIPIFRGVNDDSEVLMELCKRLVACGVRPYYFLHSMPSTLGAKEWRLPVRKMLKAVRPIIGRGFSHMCAAEAIIVGRGGKKTIPMERNPFWLPYSQIREQRVWAMDGTMQELVNFMVPDSQVFASSDPFVQFDGTPEFMYTTYLNQPVIVFKNWKDEWEMYPDAL